MPENHIYLQDFNVFVKPGKSETIKRNFSKDNVYELYYNHCFYSNFSFNSKLILKNAKNNLEICSIEFGKSETGSIEFTVPETDEYYFEITSNKKIRLFFGLAFVGKSD